MSTIQDDVLAHFGIEVNDELKHYGKKGMKWGVRKDGKRTTSDDHTESRASKKKKQSEMSNAELKRLNERLQLERTNTDLQSRGAIQKIKKGTAIAGTILAVGATVNTVVSFANSPAGKAIANAVNKNPANPDWLF